MTASDFPYLAKEVLDFQLAFNPVLREYHSVVKGHIAPDSFPFLPIQAFKSQVVKTGSWQEETIFTSSGTTQAIPSQHFVKSSSWYLDNATAIFEARFGPLKNYCILALLPSYLEREGSSLIAMVAHFQQLSGHPANGFYLYNHQELKAHLEDLAKNNVPTLLFGVSFALLDLIQQFTFSLPKLLIMETGGMKGRGKEITKMEVAKLLQNGFDTEHVYSEYGMTELFSQAYAAADGRYELPPTMQVEIKEIHDPFSREKRNKTGQIALVDLANLDSCAFILTEDLGQLHDDGRFSILGRLDQSELRGCNLMIQ